MKAKKQLIILLTTVIVIIVASFIINKAISHVRWLEKTVLDTNKTVKRIESVQSDNAFTSSLSFTF